MSTASFLLKMKKLRDMPADAAFKKLSQKIVDLVYFKIRKIRLLAAPLRIHSSDFRIFHSQSNYLFKPEKQMEYVQMMRELECEKAIIDDADMICSHRFNLLGSGLIELGDNLPWNEDFKTKFRWENKFHKDIQIIDLSNAADVKVPWELSRFQHFFTLGKAYWLTNDEKYALEFREQLEDWINNNPVEMSVNWTCTMDVAIRAANWIAGCHFFKFSPSIDQEFWGRFHGTLFQHGKYIIRNLENKGDHTGNHYLSNLVGLISLGLFFKGGSKDQQLWCSDAEVWLNYGIRELEHEMFIQVNDDGTNYEASTSYHRLVTECFLIMTVLCQQNDILFSERYMLRLEKMCDFILQTVKPDGRTPLIGDADDGRLLIISHYGDWVKNDFRHLLAVAGEFFNRSDFRWAGRDFLEDTFWIIGKHSRLDPSVSIQMQSTSYPDGGYFVLRNEQAYCLIRCGELSFHGQGTHSHNDQLSFELQVEHEDVFIDPGSFVYTADYRMRNLFRGTASHNTIQMDGKEQNDFDERLLFFMREQTFGKCGFFTEDYFKGSHQGYVNKCGIVHHREFTLRADELEIEDNLEPIDSEVMNISYYSSYIASPAMKVIQQEDKIIMYNNKISVELEWDETSKAEISDCWVSESYGIRHSSKVIRIYSSQLKQKVIIRWTSCEC